MREKSIFLYSRFAPNKTRPPLNDAHPAGYSYVGSASTAVVAASGRHRPENKSEIAGLITGMSGTTAQGISFPHIDGDCMSNPLCSVEGVVPASALTIWLDTACDWAEAQDYEYLIRRCPEDGWGMTITLRDTCGEFYVDMDARGLKREAKNNPAETFETFRDCLKRDFGHGVAKARAHRIKRLTKRAA